MKKISITLTVNGEKKTIEVTPNERLIDVLRYRLDLRSVKAGCLKGECGTCLVLMNGKPVKSCLILAAEADGSEITTVEGLGSLNKPALIQKAFIEAFGYQCGFCTNGFILLGHWILENMPDASEEEIKEVLNSVLCRCTGYKQIIEAIKLAQKWKRERK